MHSSTAGTVQALRIVHLQWTNASASTRGDRGQVWYHQLPCSWTVPKYCTLKYKINEDNLSHCTSKCSG